MKKLSILGSTGSIGTTALSVVKHREDFEVFAICAHKNVDLLIKQIKEYKPRIACLTGIDYSPELKKNAGKTEIFFGRESYKNCIEPGYCDIALIATMGISGLEMLMNCIENDIQVALANKESLVCGGKIVNEALKRKNARLLPVDSELSALFQCLKGYDISNVRRFILTASGGPFRTWDSSRIYNATLSQALNHPNWKMGQKITVDCATMLNKGFEVIETYHMFNIDETKIDVIIHPQSIIHSMVEYNNSAVLAHMSPTNMAHAIEAALSYPDINPSVCGYLDFNTIHELNFEPPDYQKFPCLKLALDCLSSGTWACVVLNAANEIAVEKFQRGEIPLGAIYDKIAGVLNNMKPAECNTLDDIYETDRQTRELLTFQTV